MRQPAWVFSRKIGNAAAVDELTVPLREPGLLLHDEPAIVQAPDERGQLDIAEALVVRAGVGEADARARPGLEGEVELPGKPAEQPRLQPRGVGFGGDPKRQG